MPAYGAVAAQDRPGRRRDRRVGDRRARHRHGRPSGRGAPQGPRAQSEAARARPAGPRVSRFHRHPHDQISAIPPRGQKRVADYLLDWLQTWDVYQAELEDFREVDDRVIAFVRARARGKGSRFDTETENADIFTLQDGKITHLRLYV